MMSRRPVEFAELSNLPAPLAERLREIIRRVRRIQWMRGLLAAATAALVSLLAVMGADAALGVESVVLRVMLTTAAAAVTLTVLWKKLIRPLSRKVSPTVVARWLELQHPETQERLSTAMGLAGKETGASSQMLEEVLKGAVSDVQAVDLAQDLGPGRLRFWRIGAGAALGIFLAILAVWPHRAPRLLARALAPLANFGNAWADSIRLLTENRIVAIGDPVEISAAVSGEPETVALHLISAEGTETVETLKPDAQTPVREGERGFTLRLPAVRESFTARFKAGRAVSEAVVITAAARPAVREMTVTYDFPDYTGRPDLVVKPADGKLEAVAGTRVTVQAQTAAAVTKAEVLLADQPVAEVRISENSGKPENSTVEWAAVLTPGLQTVWRLKAEEEHGLSATTADFPVRSLPDQAPAITLEQPEQTEMELRPTEKLPLTYVVSEDFGLSALTLHANIAGKGETLISQPLPERDPETPGLWRGEALLNLGALDLQNVSEVRARLTVADTLPSELKGAQTGTSRELLIRIRRDAKSLMEQAFLSQHEELRKMMEEARRELDDAKSRMDDKANRLREQERMDDHTLKQIEESAKFAQKANDRLQEIAERMKDTAFARQSEDVKRIAEELAKPAMEQAQNIPLTDDKKVRSELAEQAKKNLEDALKTLEKEQRQLSENKEDAKRLAQLADVAEHQEMLANAAAVAKQQEDSKPAENAPAENPVEISPEDQRKWLEEQREVAQRAKEFMEQHEKGNAPLMQQRFAESAAKAQLLAENAEALAAGQAGALEAAKAAASQEGLASPATASAALEKQNAVAQAALELQEQAAEFQQEAQQQIDQHSVSQETAWQAQVSVQNAVKKSQEAAKSQAEMVNSTNPGNPGDAAPKPAAPETGGQETAAAPSSSQENTPQDSAPPPNPPVANPGTESAAAAQTSFQEAASALKNLSQSLTAQAGMAEEHGRSLQQGAEQAGQAAEQAGQRDGQPPGMARGAEAARQAAENLSQAVETAMHSRSISQNARSSSQSKKGGKKGESSRGGANPGGQSGNELQAEGGVQGLPPELAKLGLTAADWTKMKSTLSGVEGGQAERVPEEYRELVKAYFGALAKGADGSATATAAENRKGK